MYQPRGVGLMHTRHKPSDAHYTRAEAARRKPSCERNNAVTRESCRVGHLSATDSSHSGRTRARWAPLMLSA